MFVDVGVQDSKSDIVDASAKVMPHMTYNIFHRASNSRQSREKKAFFLFSN